MIARRIGLLAVVLTLAGCDLFLVEPAAEETRPGASLTIVAGSHGGYGDLTPVFEKIDVVRLNLVSPLGARDTLLATRFVDGGIQARVQLRPEEARDWLRLDAALIGEGERLFQSDVLEYGYTVAPTRVVEVAPVVGSIVLDPQWPTLTALGDTLVIASRVLFATGDSLHGVTVQWSSPDPGVLEPLDGGRLVARSNGVVSLEGSALEETVTRSARVAQLPATLTGVAPTDTTVSVGESFELRPFGTDVRGNALLPGAQLDWAYSGGVVVNSYGSVSARSVGTGTIQVSYGGVTRTVTVTIDP